MCSEVSNTVRGGFLCGESVVVVSVAGGGIEILSNEFWKSLVGNELGFCCCLLFDGELEEPVVGGLKRI